MNEFERCLQQRKIVKIDPSEEMVENEMINAEDDLKTSGESFGRGDSKWASVQAYYSMFHSARALVLWKGYREKTHHCLLVALNHLFVVTGTMDYELAEEFEMCMSVRQAADYRHEHDIRSAGVCIDRATRFFGTARDILRNE